MTDQLSEETYKRLRDISIGFTHAIATIDDQMRAVGSVSRDCDLTWTQCFKIVLIIGGLGERQAEAMFRDGKISLD